jgi:hypothetical protein
MALALAISLMCLVLSNLTWNMGKRGWFWCFSFRVHPGLSPSRFKTLAGCFVLSVFCESLIVIPIHSPRKWILDLQTRARGDTRLVGIVVPPLQSVKLIYQSCSRLRAAWTLTWIKLEDENKSWSILFKRYA